MITTEILLELTYRKWLQGLEMDIIIIVCTNTEHGVLLVQYNT